MWNVTRVWIWANHKKNRMQVCDCSVTFWHRRHQSVSANSRFSIILIDVICFASVFLSFHSNELIMITIILLRRFIYHRALFVFIMKNLLFDYKNKHKIEIIYSDRKCKLDYDLWMRSQKNYNILIGKID